MVVPVYLKRICLGISIFAFSSVGQATTSGTCVAFPDRMHVDVSGVGEFIINRSMEEREDQWTNDMNATGFWVQGSFAPLQDLCVDARLGLAEYSLDKASYLWKTDPGMEYDPGFAYGLGLRGRVYKIPYIESWIGLGIQYDHLMPQSKNVGGTEFESEADAWNISLDLSHNLIELGPGWEDWMVYGGMRYSGYKIDYWHGPTVIGHGIFEADMPFGMYVGSEYRLWDRIHGHMEFRFIDELAITFGAGYTF